MVCDTTEYLLSLEEYGDITRTLLYSYLAFHLSRAMTAKPTSVAARNAAIKERSSAVVAQGVAQQSWLERKIKPTKVSARYPVKGAPLLYATCAFGSLGDALFGYNSGTAMTQILQTIQITNFRTGIMSGLLVNPVFVSRFFKDFGGADGSTASVDPSITGISVACLQASAALGALIAGRLGDMIGRKKCVRIGAFIYFFSAFIQIFAPGFATFVAGRTIQGLGVGFLSMTVPIIQTEIAAPHRRGLMVGIEYTFLIAGYMLSCWVDYGFNFLLPNAISWQGPFIIQIALSFILLAMSFFLPETPRWLAINGFMNESLQTIADLHSDGDTEAEHVQQVFLEIQEAVTYETNLGKSTWKVKLYGDARVYHCEADDRHRKCSRDIASGRLSESRCKCSPRSTESTSSPFTFRVLSQLQDSIIGSPFSSLRRMPCPIPPPQLSPGG